MNIFVLSLSWLIALRSAWAADIEFAKDSQDFFDLAPPAVLPGHYADGPFIHQLVDRVPPRGVPPPRGGSPPAGGDGAVETVYQVVVVTEVVDPEPITVIAGKSSVKPSSAPAKKPASTVIRPSPSPKPSPKPTPSKPTPSKVTIASKTQASPTTASKPSSSPRPSPSPKPTPTKSSVSRRTQAVKKTGSDLEGDESETKSVKPTRTTRTGFRRSRLTNHRRRRRNVKPFNINDYKSSTSHGAFALPTADLLTANNKKNDAAPVTSPKSFLLLLAIPLALLI